MILMTEVSDQDNVQGTANLGGARAGYRTVPTAVPKDHMTVMTKPGHLSRKSDGVCIFLSICYLAALLTIPYGLRSERAPTGQHAGKTEAEARRASALSAQCLCELIRDWRTVTVRSMESVETRSSRCGESRCYTTYIEHLGERNKFPPW